MTRSTKPSTRKVAKKISKATGVDPKVVEQAIINAIVARNRDKADGYLSYQGIMPLDLPDGTRIAILPDIHVPAHDKRIIWAIKAFLEDFKPHILIFIGDVADVFALSRWPKPPRVRVDLQKELDETRRLVDSLMKISGAYWTFYIMGNHEDRCRRYLTDPASGLSGMLDFATREPVMSFHGLMGYKPGDPVTFIYDLDERSGFGGAVIVNGDMEYHHGYLVRPMPGASPLADADKQGHSVTHGHTHRAGMRVRLKNNGEVLRGIELGHVVDVTHPYMGYANLLNNWHPALGASHVVGGKVHTQILPIKQVNQKGRMKSTIVYAGKAYVASDR